jgi:serine protease
LFGGINAPAAWDITTGSANTVVAVLDTGYTAHPDLQDRLLPGYDFISDADIANDGDGREADASDPGDWVTSADLTLSKFKDCKASNSSWHGTAVAGVIGASTQNGRDVAGVDWNARILPVRVLGKCGGQNSDILDGMLWAAGVDVPFVPKNPNPAKVLNLSLGSAGPCSNSERNVFNQLTAAGTIIVVSAGNDNSSADQSPANCPGAISVAATAHSGARASYSSYGSKVTLAAPGGDGGDLITLDNTGTTAPGSPAVAGTSGTSFSAPVVSGVISLMLALRPDLNTASATRILAATARPFPDTSCTTSICGAGIVDAAAALRATRDSALGVATFVSFADADVGRPNPDLTLKVTNLSASPMSLGSVLLTAGAGEFSLPANGCTLVLPPDGTCTISLRFNPTGVGTRTGSLSIFASDGRTYNLTLSGYAYASARILEQTAGTSVGPQYMAKASDGTYWYSQPSPNRIARMRPNGEVTEFPVPTASSNPFDITAGPDGNMWFTELDAGRIGRISLQGAITEFPLPVASAQPRGITTGADGNLWFTEISTGRIGRITPQGTITEFVIPWGSASPRGITAGPDGNLWFTDSGAPCIGRLTPSGVFTRFDLPWTSVGLRAITTGPDGNLWFVELSSDRVGRITPAGVATQFPLPRSGEGALGITAGPDGAVWYTASSASRVGRVNTATGQVSEYRLPSSGSNPIGITTGPNNTMWIAGSGSNKIATLNIAGISGAPVLSDLWWGGTAENGWGMTVQQHGNTQFNVFFVYDGSGKPIWYVMPGCTWNSDFSVCDGQLYKPTGSALNAYSAAQFAAGPVAGAVSLSFTSTNTATLQYVINGVSGQKTIQRQVFGAVDGTAGLQVGDMWWGSPTQNGWGVSISQQYRTLFAAWYTYDLGGNVTWFTMPGGTWSGNTYSGVIAATTSSPWIGVPYNAALFAPSVVGNVSFAFSDANNAVMTYTFTSGPFAGTTQSKPIVRQPY